MLKIKESLLTEKFIDNISHSYKIDIQDGSSSKNFCAKYLKLQFIDWILDTKKDYIIYGIYYLKRTYPDVYEVLNPLVLEWQTYGSVNFVEPEETEEYISEDIPKKSFIDNFKTLSVKLFKKLNFKKN